MSFIFTIKISSILQEKEDYKDYYHHEALT